MRVQRTLFAVLGITALGLLFAGSAVAQQTWWVQSADYGWNNQRRDVTNTVKRLVNGPNFTVNNANLGTDPAKGKDKTLRIVARDSGGKVRDFSYKEGATVNSRMFAGGPNSGYPGWGGGGGGGGGWNGGGGSDRYGLQIASARWGAGNRQQDVTRRLQNLVRNNRINVKVDPKTMGGDPAPGTSKQLTVHYNYNGKNRSTVVPEGGFLTIP